MNALTIRVPSTKALMAVVAAALTALVAVSLVAVPAAEAKSKGKKGVVRVMTRNVYLGADLGPGLDATGFADLSQGAGQILRDVDKNNFKLRAKQLAREIKSANPDLVGLQEVALWRTVTPPNVYLPGQELKAKTVRYDFLKLLLGNLKGYKQVVVQNQFDFETPANADDESSCYAGNWTGALGNSNQCALFPGADLTGRLTMRDVIIAKKKVKTSANDKANYDNLYTPVVAGAVPLPVTRGWTATTARVPGAKPFRFVNTHFEAFGDPEEAKCEQAKELYPEAIAGNSLPVVLAGDLNSDDDTVDGDPATPELDGTGWDRCAYNYLKSEGLSSLTRGTDSTCCLDGSLLSARKASVYRKQFSHQVDHLMTNDAAKVMRVGKSKATGTRPFRKKGTPAWGSDHQGVAQAVKIK